MKSLKYMLPLLLAFAVPAGLIAADEAKPAAETKAAGAETTLHGALGEKPADAKPNVVATLKYHEKGAAKGESKTINLAATGDVATELTTLLGKKAHVEVTGTLDGDTMTVTKAAEHVSKKKKDESK